MLIFKAVGLQIRLSIEWTSCLDEFTNPTEWKNQKITSIVQHATTKSRKV